MSNESIEIILSIVGSILVAFSIPIGWLFIRQNKIQSDLSDVYSKEEVKEYISLKQETLHVKLDNLAVDVEEVKTAMLRMEQHYRKRDNR